MTTFMYQIMMILVIAFVTFGTRVMPFIFFRDPLKTPKAILYLGKALPPAIMLMLILYSIKSVPLDQMPYGIPEILSILLVIRLHLWKRNNLISILGGTGFYMVLVQVVFG